MYEAAMHKAAIREEAIYEATIREADLHEASTREAGFPMSMTSLVVPPPPAYTR